MFSTELLSGMNASATASDLTPVRPDPVSMIMVVTAASYCDLFSLSFSNLVELTVDRRFGALTRLLVDLLFGHQ